MTTQILESEEIEACDLIDKIKNSITLPWFVTKEDIETKIKPNLKKYYDFVLFILNVCEVKTDEEKEIKEELEDIIINDVEIIDDDEYMKEGKFE